eukprot:757721-Hanusia_phi.AAC.2
MLMNCLVTGCPRMTARSPKNFQLAVLIALHSLELVDSACQCTLSTRIPESIFKTCDVRKGVCPYEFSGCGAQSGLYEESTKFAGGFPISVCVIAENSTCQGETKLLKGAKWVAQLCQADNSI